MRLRRFALENDFAGSRRKRCRQNEEKNQTAHVETLRRKNELRELGDVFLGSENHSCVFCKRSAFAITETELRLIAAPAIIGLRSKPKKG